MYIQNRKFKGNIEYICFNKIIGIYLNNTKIILYASGEIILNMAPCEFLNY